MKLWLKVSLLAIILVALSTGLCSLIMLLRSGQSNLDLAVRSALTDQQMRAGAWSAAMENAIDAEYGTTAIRSLARYLIDKFADENTVLVSGDDFIYNATPIDPREYLPVAGEARQYTIRDIGGKSMLIAGSGVQIGGDRGQPSGGPAYTLYFLKDLTNVYAGIEALSYQFALINLAVILAASAGIIALVRWVLRPISSLKQSTGLIAAGIYDKRVEIMENDEIGELASHFNQMAAAVERHVEQLRDEADRRTLFMSALTHELKTPITSISGNAQTLLRTRMDDDEREDALVRIDGECTRIERLSQKLMQLIVLRQNERIPMEAHSVAGLLESVRQSCEEQLKQRGLQLTVESNMGALVMDGDLLSSLLLNLIDNAGKASEPGGAIELTARDGTIAVTDHGRGIAPEELGRITQPFYTGDQSRSRKAGGIGLGLALAEEIARLHGARLAFESAPGAGTTAKVIFRDA